MVQPLAPLAPSGGLRSAPAPSAIAVRAVSAAAICRHGIDGVAVSDVGVWMDRRCDARDYVN